MTAFRSHFYQADAAYLMFDHQTLIAANTAACFFMGTDESTLMGLSFSTLFPIPHETQNAVIQTLRSPTGNEYSVVTRYITLSEFQFVVRINQPLMNENDIAPEELVQDTRRFRKLLEQLNDVYLELSAYDNLDDLYKHAIILGREKLQLDRIGLLLIDEHTKEQYGTWGTNTKGELMDEHSWRAPMANTPWVKQAFREPRFCYFWEDIDLLDWGIVVGRGWSGMANLWHDSKVFGWLACDNLIERKPLTPAMQEIFRLYALNLSQIIVRKKSELEIQQTNAHLNELVAKKTAALNEQIFKMQSVQAQLIQQEKMASLGGMVAGVAHEINTPLGNALVSLSQVKHCEQTLVDAVDKNQLTKSLLSDSLKDIADATELLEKSLNRAAGLVRSFKQLATQQTAHQVASINLHDTVSNLLSSYTHQYKNRPIQCINNIPSELTIFGAPAKYMQIFTQLLDNALKHAFPEQHASGSIHFQASCTANLLTISYHDDGIGIPEQNKSLVFDPFYTTARSQGASGLGLAIIYQVVTQELNGDITISNLEPTGCQIEINIPLNPNP